MTKLHYYPGFWTRNDVKYRDDCLFIFGDNDIEQGAGGQAIIRGMSNAFGIPTKKYPNNNNNSYYTDNEYDENIKKIDNAISKIISESKKYKYIVLPENGLGTGLAQLPIKAPKTFKYLQKRLNELELILI